MSKRRATRLQRQERRGKARRRASRKEDPPPHEIIRAALRAEMQTSMLGLVSQLFRDEVEALCGARYKRHRDAVAERGGGDRNDYGVEHVG